MLSSMRVVSACAWLMALAACGDGADVVLGQTRQQGGDGGYQPCGEKVCGDPCWVCDPNDPTCVETANLKWCDNTGKCDGTRPSC
jgi:hypothetical protein